MYDKGKIWETPSVKPPLQENKDNPISQNIQECSRSNQPHTDRRGEGRLRAQYTCCLVRVCRLRSSNTAGGRRAVIAWASRSFSKPLSVGWYGKPSAPFCRVCSVSLCFSPLTRYLRHLSCRVENCCRARDTPVMGNSKGGTSQSVATAYPFRLFLS